MADISTIAKQFTDFYYQTFDSDRAALQSLYRPTSMLTFEGTQHLGAPTIVEKLQGLPFQRVQHKVTTIDAQPSSTSGEASLLVLVTGLLVVDDSPNPLNFSQTFQLIPDSGSYYVFNDIFRLNYS
ncbi:nuclear transport factor 2 [Dentipellis sp. KUC8613]|nr:nuclear transport factor 2 [Dentipellis sp. KUC8613]